MSYLGHFMALKIIKNGIKNYKKILFTRVLAIHETYFDMQVHMPIPCKRMQCHIQQKMLYRTMKFCSVSKKTLKHIIVVSHLLFFTSVMMV